MRIVVGCEFSQIVTRAFRDRGHEAYSCDVLPTEGNPKWHFQEDILGLLRREKFDLGIFHPPCTYLSSVGNRHWNNPGRDQLRLEAFDFFMCLWNTPLPRICIENPVGYMNKAFRKPDQIVHPYFFGDLFTKRTCLWLKGLPKLKYDFSIIPKPEPLYICQGKKCKGKKIYFTEGLKGCRDKDRWKFRSRTALGIARAMAEQWQPAMVGKSDGANRR